MNEVVWLTKGDVPESQSVPSQRGFTPQPSRAATGWKHGMICVPSISGYRTQQNQILHNVTCTLTNPLNISLFVGLAS